MAHARRKLFEVFETTKSPIAEEALRRIQELYAIEADIKGRTADQRWMQRQTRSKPLLDAYHVWAIALQVAHIKLCYSRDEVEAHRPRHRAHRGAGDGAARKGEAFLAG
jgi:hypothetical protein